MLVSKGVAGQAISDAASEGNFVNGWAKIMICKEPEEGMKRNVTNGVEINFQG